MNSSDEDKDKLLSSHLQHVFRDFEHDPPPGTGRPIWQAIAYRTAVYRRFATGSILLLLLIGAGVYVMSPEQITHADGVNRNMAQRADGPKRSVPVGQRTRRPSTEQASVYVGQTYAAGKSSDRPWSVARSAIQLTQSGVERVDTANVPMKTSRAGRKRSRPVGETTGWVAQTASRQLIRGSVATLVEPGTGPNAAASEPVAGDNRNRQLVEPLPYGAWRERTMSIRRSVYWPLTLPASTTSERVAPSARLRLFFGVAPVSSYQRMVIVNTPETYVQHVAAPSAFAASTWGYQVSGGLEWKQTAIQLSVGTIRRWAYYGVADGRFSVTPTETNQYEVRRLDKPVAESESLRLLSAGISQQVRVGRAHSPYFTRLGGSASYVPATGQSLAWVTASAGLTLPLTSTYQLQVGPTLEYGLSRLWSNERQLIIYPYLVGVTLSLHTQRP